MTAIIEARHRDDVATRNAKLAQSLESTHARTRGRLKLRATSAVTIATDRRREKEREYNLALLVQPRAVTDSASANDHRDGCYCCCCCCWWWCGFRCCSEEAGISAQQHR